MDPRHLSRYCVIERLADGGSGVVFLGEDATLGRKVALKVLHSEPAAREGLLKEARAAAQLDHPFICKVYEVGDDGGRPFLAMEYVSGTTIAKRLRSRSLPADEALRIATEIADALDFAHSHGIVHRDIKPSNVMLGPEGHVKVMDFGIARRIPRLADGNAVTVDPGTASLPGQVTGTLAYMSPEQLRGEHVDARSDIFSFGVMLQEMLTGRHPFARASSLEIASAILTEEAAALPADVPQPLHDVVKRCLQKDRAQRFQSMADLRRVLEGPGLAVATASTAASRPTRQWRWPLAAAIMVATLAGLLAWLGPTSLVKPDPVLAFSARNWLVVSDFNNLTGDPVFDQSLRLAMEVAIAQSQYVNVFPQNRIAATLQRMERPPAALFNEALAIEVAIREGIRGVLACDIAQLGGVYSLTTRLVDPHTKAVVLTDSVQARGKDEVLSALGQLARRVRENLGESLEELSAQSRELPMATTRSIEALKLYAEGVNDSSVGGTGMLLQAIAIDPQFALAHSELGRRYYLAPDRASREQGEVHLAKALALSDRLTLRERLWIQAVAEDSRGNRPRAVEAYSTYLAQYPDDTGALFRKSWTQMATLGLHREAAEGFRRLVQLDPGSASAHVNLATALSQDDESAAITAYEKAFGLNPRLIVGVFVNHEYGFTLVRNGRLDAAAAVFERMKREAEPVNQGKGFRSMALLHMLRGQYGAARDELRDAIALNRTYQQSLSEFRDRLFLISALDATARGREAEEEWREVDRLKAKLSLGPEWLGRAAVLKARSGRILAARRELDRIRDWEGKATADSGIGRNLANDAAYVAAAEAVLDLAEGRTSRALERSETAHLQLKSPETLFTFAATAAAAGRLEQAIARYEEFLGRLPFGTEAQEQWFEAHLLLGRLYEQKERRADARRVYQSLLDRWKEADPDIVLLRSVRARLADLD